MLGLNATLNVIQRKCSELPKLMFEPSSKVCHSLFVYEYLVFFRASILQVFDFFQPKIIPKSFLNFIDFKLLCLYR